jgi:hypothetical protein
MEHRPPFFLFILFCQEQKNTSLNNRTDEDDEGYSHDMVANYGTQRTNEQSSMK